MRRAVDLLNEMANSDASMGDEDIHALCEARRILAKRLGYAYDEDTNRYERAG